MTGMAFHTRCSCRVLSLFTQFGLIRRGRQRDIRLQKLKRDPTSVLLSMDSENVVNTESLTRYCSPYLYKKEDHLYCEQVKVKDIQEKLEDELQQPSPFFLYSKAQIVENVTSYRKALDDAGVSYLLGYSIKANYNPRILSLFKELGCTGVAVSGHEIQLALRAGMQPQNVIYNGTGKQGWELQLAVESQCFINVDSGFDLRHVISTAQNLQKPAKLLLRINPDIDSRVHSYLATGRGASKFGIDESQVWDLVNQIKQEPEVDLVGVHCHLGSTIDNTSVFRECGEVMQKLFDIIREKGFPDLKYVNLGGGLGIPHRIDMPMPTPAELIKAVQHQMKSRDQCLILEPGRSLIGNAAVLITKVIGWKKNAGTNYIVVDGAMTEVIRPSLYGAYHHIDLTEPTKSSRVERDLFDVVGPVCECADFLGKARELCYPHEGCGLAVFDVGAYCGSMGSNYNMRMKPAEVLVDGSTWKLIRRPDCIDDVIKPYDV